MDESPSSSSGCSGPLAATWPVIPAAGDGRWRTVFDIPRMDCPAEEQIIRLRLAALAGLVLAFDLPRRRLTVEHSGSAEAILARLEPLGFGAAIVSTEPVATTQPAVVQSEGVVLRLLLAINACMFVFELGLGWWAGSVGLIADAMDMFADAAVYGVALYAVGRSARHQLAAARLAGGLQLCLALSALAETARHWHAGLAPEPLAMLGVAAVALVANSTCLVLIFRYRQGAAHLRASYLFSASDVLANLGVLAAGGLVLWLGQPWPDWVVGGAVGFLVLAAAVRILRLR